MQLQRLTASAITSIAATCSTAVGRLWQVAAATSSAHRSLERYGLNRLPTSRKHQLHGKRWQRYEKARPGHRLQMDVKFLERIPGTTRRLYQFTAIDDCTRIRVLKVYDACNQRTAEVRRTSFATGWCQPLDREPIPRR